MLCLWVAYFLVSAQVLEERDMYASRLRALRERVRSATSRHKVQLMPVSLTPSLSSAVLIGIAY